MTIAVDVPVVIYAVAFKSSLSLVNDEVNWRGMVHVETNVSIDVCIALLLIFAPPVYGFLSKNN